jgi:hypothetical protein
LHKAQIKVDCTRKHKSLPLSEDDKRFKGNLDFSDNIMDLETPFQFIKYFLKNDLLKKTV